MGLSKLFTTPITAQDGALVGPWRAPKQMLGDQTYDGHASIHDDATAQSLGFNGGTIEGPTHFSQFAPLCVAHWGEDWLARGGLSAHYSNAAFEGDEVRATLTPRDDGQADIRMEKRDGVEVLSGTASFGAVTAPSALDVRLANLRAPSDLVIHRDVEAGMMSPRIPVAMRADQHMGDLYPFSLADKLKRITENSPAYETIIPLEMVSVLLNHVSRLHAFPSRGPCVGLFVDQEIRAIDGPLLIDATYEIEREVVALSASRRTESLWVRTHVYHPGESNVIATMLLNTASLKASYANYEREYAELYGKSP